MVTVVVTPETATLGMKKVEQNEKVDSNTAAVPADDKLGSDNSGQRELNEAPPPPSAISNLTSAGQP